MTLQKSFILILVWKKKVYPPEITQGTNKRIRHVREHLITPQ